jgi:hypothetical protein
VGQDQRKKYEITVNGIVINLKKAKDGFLRFYHFACVTAVRRKITKTHTPCSDHGGGGWRM